MSKSFLGKFKIDCFVFPGTSNKADLPTCTFKGHLKVASNQQIKYAA